MDRERIKAELDQIREANGGVLEPAAVVDFARDPETALHWQFDWDDSEAAEKWRLHQARNVINCVVVVLPQTNEPIRAFVSLVSDRVKGGGYRDAEAVLTDADLRAQWLDQALRELQAWRAKYQRLKALAPIFEAMDAIDGQPRPRRRPRPVAAEARA